MLIIENKKDLKQRSLKTEKIDFSINDFKFDLNTNEVKQDVVLTIQNKTILTLGAFLVLTGKPKARKTTFLHAIISTLINSNEIWTIKGHLQSNKNKVVLIDTEQSKFDLYHSLTRLSNNLNCKLNEVPNLDVYTVRSGDVQTIKKLIIEICKNDPAISVICIDGLIDLVDDINDVKQAKQTINFLKEITDTYNVALIGILHQNKGTNYSLGHLGSFASRFAQSELSIEKTDQGSSTLKSTFLRSADDINTIEIIFDEYENKYKSINENDHQDQQNFNPNYEINIIDELFVNQPYYTFADFTEKIKDKFNCTTYKAQKTIIPNFYKLKLIKKNKNYIVKI
jgi:hypothetical protein